MNDIKQIELAELFQIARTTCPEETRLAVDVLEAEIIASAEILARLVAKHNPQVMYAGPASIEEPEMGGLCLPFVYVSGEPHELWSTCDPGQWETDNAVNKGEPNG